MHRFRGSAIATAESYRSKASPRRTRGSGKPAFFSVSARTYAVHVVHLTHFINAAEQFSARQRSPRSSKRSVNICLTFAHQRAPHTHKHHKSRKRKPFTKIFSTQRKTKRINKLSKSKRASVFRSPLCSRTGRLLFRFCSFHVNDAAAGQGCDTNEDCLAGFRLLERNKTA